MVWILEKKSGNPNILPICRPLIFLHGKGKLFTPGPTFSVRGQIVNILGFAGHTVSVSTTQLCWCSKWV